MRAAIWLFGLILLAAGSSALAATVPAPYSAAASNTMTIYATGKARTADYYQIQRCEVDSAGHVIDGCPIVGNTSWFEGVVEGPPLHYTQLLPDVFVWDPQWDCFVLSSAVCTKPVEGKRYRYAFRPAWWTGVRVPDPTWGLGVVP